jgi:predicted metalloprotease with PDZ domain
MHRAHEADDRDIDLRFSLGFYVNDDATLEDVIPGSPADAAGLTSGERLVAVNGRKWSKEELRDALAATARGATTTTLLLQKDDLYRSVDLHYSGGPREPHLMRVPGSVDLLTLIARPRAPAAH